MAHYCVQILKPSKPWLNLLDLCKSKLCLTKPKPQTCSRPLATKTQEPDLQRQPHAPPRMDNGSWNSHTRRHRFSTPSLDLSHTRHQDSLAVHRSTWPENLVVIRRCTCHHAPPGFLASPPRTGEHCTLLPRADTTSDVIWRHQMASSLHVSSHASTSTSALVHVIRHVN